jgi:hypothetical protein
MQNRQIVEEFNCEIFGNEIETRIFANAVLARVAPQAGTARLALTPGRDHRSRLQLITYH